MLPPLNWPLAIVVFLLTFILIRMFGFKGITRLVAAAAVAFFLYTPVNNQLRLFAFSGFKQVVVINNDATLAFENVGRAHAKMLVARLMYGASRVKCEGGLRSKEKAIPYELEWEGGYTGFFEVRDRPGLYAEFTEYFGLFRHC
jgi:hypothetical protein